MQFTLVELWQHMGWFARGIVLALGLMSIMSMLVMFERWFVFSRSRRDSLRDHGADHGRRSSAKVDTGAGALTGDGLSGQLQPRAMG